MDNGVVVKEALDRPITRDVSAPATAEHNVQVLAPFRRLGALAPSLKKIVIYRICAHLAVSQAMCSQVIESTKASRAVRLKRERNGGREAAELIEQLNRGKCRVHDEVGPTELVFADEVHDAQCSTGWCIL